MSEFRYLTPEVLRKAADLLAPDRRYWAGKTLFMCWAVSQQFPGIKMRAAAEIEMMALLREHGVISPESLTMDEFAIEPDKIHEEERQAVRFMLLEFLAHSIEEAP